MMIDKQHLAQQGNAFGGGGGDANLFKRSFSQEIGASPLGARDVPCNAVAFKDALVCVELQHRNLQDEGRWRRLTGATPQDKTKANHVTEPQIGAGLFRGLCIKTAKYQKRTPVYRNPKFLISYDTRLRVLS